MSKDYKAMYEALCKDVRENYRDICGACVQAQLPRGCNEDMDCETCKEECLCRHCRDCDHWQWRGEEQGDE